MPRAALAFALLVLAAVVPALETPLTLTNGNKALVIDPVFGSITAYQVSNTDANRLGLNSRNPAGNFLDDLDKLQKTPVERPEGDPLPLIRIGINSKPSYGDYFAPNNQWLSDKPTKREAAAGQKALMFRAYKGEDAFWKGKVAYDGVVRAAVTPGYLALAVPSLHTLLVYKLDSDAATLFAVCNWGPALYVQTGKNTSPDPNALLKMLPADKQKEAFAALGLDDPAAQPAGGAPAPVGVAAEEPPTPKSEAWIGASGNDTFLVVDTANERALLYQVSGKAMALIGVRDLHADLVIPGLAGGGLRSTPFGDTMVKDYLQARKSYLAKYSLPTDMDGIIALVQQHQGKAGGKASDFEGVMVNGVAFLNFVKNRVFLTLDCSLGNGVNLVAARDTTIDVAMALMDQDINNRNEAQTLLGKLSANSQPKSLLAFLRYVFSLDPSLWKDADAKLKGAFKGDLKPEYQALIDEAKAKAEERKKAEDERNKAAEERRQQRQKQK